MFKFQVATSIVFELSLRNTQRYNTDMLTDMITVFEKR